MSQSFSKDRLQSLEPIKDMGEKDLREYPLLCKVKFDVVEAGEERKASVHRLCHYIDCMCSAIGDNQARVIMTIDPETYPNGFEGNLRAKEVEVRIQNVTLGEKDISDEDYEVMVSEFLERLSIMLPVIHAAGVQGGWKVMANEKVDQDSQE